MSWHQGWYTTPRHKRSDTTYWNQDMTKTSSIHISTPEPLWSWQGDTGVDPAKHITLCRSLTASHRWTSQTCSLAGFCLHHLATLRKRRTLDIRLLDRRRYEALFLSHHFQLSLVQLTWKVRAIVTWCPWWIEQTFPPPVRLDGWGGMAGQDLQTLVQPYWGGDSLSALGVAKSYAKTNSELSNSSFKPVLPFVQVLSRVCASTGVRRKVLSIPTSSQAGCAAASSAIPPAAEAIFLLQINRELQLCLIPTALNKWHFNTTMTAP